MRLARLLLAFVLLGLALGARAQVSVSGKADHLDLWPHVRMLVEPAGGALAPEQVLARRDQFGPPKGAYATLGMDKEVLWLRVPVAVASGGQGEWILDLDYALLRRVDVYAVFDGKVSRLATLGDTVPFESRPMRGRAHSVAMTLDANTEGEILMRLDTPGGKIMPLSLDRLPVFHQRAINEHLLQGALASLGLVLLLYSLLQWLHLRENLYLKYALLVLCSATFSAHYFGIGEMYLWTDNAWAQRHMAGVTALMAAAATALFIEDAMAGDLNHWLRFGLRFVAGVHLLATLAYGADLIDIQTVAIFMSTTGLAPTLLGLPGALAKARRGDTVGYWFMAAWVGYFIASAVLVGVVRGRVGVNFWTMHSFQIGATFDMLCFMRIALLRTATRHREAQRAAKERDALFSMAHSDALTGLLNRRGLADALSEGLDRASPARILALFVLDLDGFKPVNDQFGHDVGDALLRVVAQRLRGSVRAGDAVARVGGDEFVVMAENLAHEPQARDLGLKLLDAFKAPFTYGEHSSRVSATIGYALAPLEASDATALLKAADAAMYKGKEEGKNRLVRMTVQVN